MNIRMKGPIIERKKGVSSNEWINKITYFLLMTIFGLSETETKNI